MNQGTWREVATLDEVPAGTILPIVVDGVAMVIVNVGDTVRAFQALCSHEEYPLADGYVDGDQLVCTLHGSTFDAQTGQVRLGPADTPLARHEAEVRGDRIAVRVAEASD